eukprot:CAMPEP_0172490136 /NCGR_PEP_ID=MMETSP1066-20121228/20470_1 /TAXON_ID=671091 /ORGANISM="Coscinodiscus wailesii, Strain CCMP2513" /LENGTH=434 /DNA_ID=CAMNT_0013258451 /DNA_START=106 /DNA_END=1410 /DNA_ORIENTATION=+
MQVTDVIPKPTIVIIAFLAFISFQNLVWDNEQIRKLRRVKKERERGLSINLGGGDCEWTEPKALGPDPQIFGTLLAAYPGSGMRLLWQHAEGLTGIEVGDDYDFSPDTGHRSGIIKTAYPNLEGIWSYGDTMDQVILIVSNPRWGIPSYHTMLYEIEYAPDYETALRHMHKLFTKRPEVQQWKKFRDHRFQEEVLLWRYFIDYWMAGGEQYWMDGDFERNGQYPYGWVNKTDRKIDEHCIYDLDCFPTAVLSYELLHDPVTGPIEARKLAKALDGKLGIDVIDEEARECVWHKVKEFKEQPDLDGRNRNPVKATEYGFTLAQLRYIKQTLIEMRNEYSAGEWEKNKLAQELVLYLDMYLEDNEPEIEEMQGYSSPTPAPNEEYIQSLHEWYASLGRGERYSRYDIEMNTTAIDEQNTTSVKGKTNSTETASSAR